MTSLDTNVLARFILEDEPEQTRRAEAIICGEQCFVCDTVLLELAWVLSSSGRMSRAEVAARLNLLLNPQTITVRDEPALRAALADAREGMDLADALHRAFSPGADRIVTFERHFSTVAAARPGVPVEAI